MMNITQALDSYGRFFIVPMDHPLGDDTAILARKGVLQLVRELDDLPHDGYIFGGKEFMANPIKTIKDYFVTVGEYTEGYKAAINEVEEKVASKKITFYFEVESPEDEAPFTFYDGYIQELKSLGFLTMAMAFPTEDAVGNCYPAIARIAHRLGADLLKSDYYPEVGKLPLNGMKLCIGGGALIADDKEFEHFTDQVESLKTASLSFGRNIHEADHYRERIEMILEKLGR
jgi:DhnA family fructose-bisphosphate aldolase class Ia